MPSHAKQPALPALALLLAILLPAVAVGADGKPDLSGTWTFARQRSDDLPQKIAAAVGPDYTVGSKKSEQARVWIRSWLEGFAEHPEKRALTIEQTPAEFKSGLGDEVTGRLEDAGSRFQADSVAHDGATLATQATIPVATLRGLPLSGNSN